MDVTDKKSIQWAGVISAQFKCSCGRRLTVYSKTPLRCLCGNRFWLGTRLFVEVHNSTPRKED